MSQGFKVVWQLHVIHQRQKREIGGIVNSITAGWRYYFTILWRAAALDYCETMFQTYIQREQLILTTIIKDCVMDNVYWPTFFSKSL
jgi:hypothetical protein